jgi:hypothetical protein
MIILFKRTLLGIVVTSLAACATPRSYDYTALQQSKPRSILVLPPLNRTPDIHATYSVLSTVTQPLAENGYYVFPVALVDQTFKENGLPNPDEMHQAPLNKLREIFGADAVLYLTVTQYGSSYKVISSDITVSVAARLVDVRTGQLLWDGSATASQAQNDSGGGGLAGMLIKAVVNQIVNNVVGDSANRPIARLASTNLLSAQPGGLLYGPRSPMYGK